MCLERCFPPPPSRVQTKTDKFSYHLYLSASKFYFHFFLFQSSTECIALIQPGLYVRVSVPTSTFSSWLLCGGQNQGSLLPGLAKIHTLAVAATSHLVSSIFFPFAPDLFLMFFQAKFCISIGDNYILFSISLVFDFCIGRDFTFLLYLAYLYILNQLERNQIFFLLSIQTVAGMITRSTCQMVRCRIIMRYCKGWEGVPPHGRVELTMVFSSTLLLSVFCRVCRFTCMWLYGFVFTLSSLN